MVLVHASTWVLLAPVPANGVIVTSSSARYWSYCVPGEVPSFCSVIVYVIVSPALAVVGLRVTPRAVPGMIDAALAVARSSWSQIVFVGGLLGFAQNVTFLFRP